MAPGSVSLRQRLGGKRAISWQAVVIGDTLIVLLATLLAAASPGTRRVIDAAVDAFAITAATAIVAAVYTGLAHVTIFRNREQHPVPVPVMIGFHLSIGVLFLVGFAVGAAILSVPRLGGSLGFSMAVLAGGLLVCLPTTLLLDHADRYRKARVGLIFRVVESERLRISEWSLRRALRSLVGQVNNESTLADLTDRLDMLDLSDDASLSTMQLWQVSHDHHQESAPTQNTAGTGLGRRESDGEALTTRIAARIDGQFPAVRWSASLPAVTSTPLRFPFATSFLSIVMVWVFLTSFLPSSVAVPIAFTVAAGIVVEYRFLGFGSTSQVRSPVFAAIAIALWAGGAAIVWSIVGLGPVGLSSVAIAGGAVATSAAAVLSVMLVGWVSAVVDSREDQLAEIEALADRRQAESRAVFASLLVIVSKMAETVPVTSSPALAASATGLQRVQRDMSAQQARRIIDWTESVVSAPGVVPAVGLAAQVNEILHPWRALAEITIDCQEVDVALPAITDIVAVVEEGVRNACRHGDADNIHVGVTVDDNDVTCVEIVDDGIGPGTPEPGMGFDRFATLGTGGFEITDRFPDSGTRLVVNIVSTDGDPRRRYAESE